MYLIRGQHNLELFRSRYPKNKLCGTIGNFDGMHLGHQAILEKIKKNSKKYDAKTIVFFTEPHAAEYFAKIRDENSEMPPRICPWREKVKLLKKYELEYPDSPSSNSSVSSVPAVLGFMRVSVLPVLPEFPVFAVFEETEIEEDFAFAPPLITELVGNFHILERLVELKDFRV